MAGTSPSIAIVDDDAPVLKALRRLLRGRGFETAIYGSAREFLTALPRHRPDCLIIDVQMPEMNGIELLQQLRRRGVKMPTIMITAHGGEDIAERCMAAGAVAFLEKPLQNAPLFEAIGKASRQAG